MKNYQVGLLITGSEILSFKTKDTNGPFIGMHLRKIGVPIRASMMCGDDESDILDCLHYLSEKCDIILMTGGLGPTCDDLTAEVVAKFFHVKTIFCEKAWENCVEAYKKFTSNPVPESNKKQAYLPEGCKILENKIGTAVGFCTTGEINGKKISIYCMPGVPFEMEPMFLNEVFPFLREESYAPISKTWQVFFMGESAMQSAMDSAEKNLHKQFPSSAISYQAHAGYVTYSATLFPQTKEQENSAKQFLENEFIPAVEKSFHKHILYSDATPLAEYIVKMLKQKDRTLVFVEGSCGGTLSKQVSSIAYSEDVFKCARIAFGHREFLMEFSKYDIIITEYGSSTPELATGEMPHGHYKIKISLKKEIIKNESDLTRTLENFHWKLEENFLSTHHVHFVNELKVSTRAGKEVQQLRVALNCLCSLALVVPHI